MMSKEKNILFLLILLLSLVFAASYASQSNDLKIFKKLTTLEKSFKGYLGVFFLDSEKNRMFAYRSDERFPLCSTSKLMAVSAILKKSQANPDFLNKSIVYNKADLLDWSLVTRNRVKKGMSISELCKAAIIFNDNTAVNLLMSQLGGPVMVTHFARSIGDKYFGLMVKTFMVECW